MNTEHRFTITGPCVVVPERVASVLHEYLTQLRIHQRGRDVEVHQVLLDMAHCAMAFRSRNGTSVAPQPEPNPDLRQWIGTTAAAERLGITTRGVRRAIERGHLAASLDDGRWRLTRDAVEQYLMTRNY